MSQLLSTMFSMTSNRGLLTPLKTCCVMETGTLKYLSSLIIQTHTIFRNYSSWNIKTLENLGILSLYLSSDFWCPIKIPDLQKFLKHFIPQQRKNKALPKVPYCYYVISISKSLQSDFLNLTMQFSFEASCTADNITLATINDGAFPVGYDLTQFDLCLGVSIARDDLAALTGKVDDENGQMIIMAKLNEVYPSVAPEDQVQLFGPTFHQASLNEISRWTITKLDTLAALVDSTNGAWDSTKAKAIITKYLASGNNSLGSAELNSIGGTNLCSLDISVLETIATDSLR
uniref:Uncharacterized protein n=1 Tax=Lepisosteus oculatus TaxID=7918 RepID=W5M960_LEPOC